MPGRGTHIDELSTSRSAVVSAVSTSGTISDPEAVTATLVAMIWLAVGLIVGVCLSAPILPLLRMTDRDFGRAAAGLTAVAVLMLAVRMYLELVDHEDVPAKNVLTSAFNSLLVVKGVFGFAVAVAVVGVFVRRRA